MFIETAGGVNTPLPSGSTQADAYMPLRLPAILVGDWRPGGISATISAFESLRMRGYDVVYVMTFTDDRCGNFRYFGKYFTERYEIPVWQEPRPPSTETGPEEMQRWYTDKEKGRAREVLEALDRYHKDRINRVRSMAAVAYDKIWFPFTQHQALRRADISAIDSAHGDFFQMVTLPPSTRAHVRPILKPVFDGSASWWTQGLGHGNLKLSLAAAYAASRYGHVTLAKAVHEPALLLAEQLLGGLENPRLARVFFSDNGSTGMEVAVKMALRAACRRYGWGVCRDVEVLGLRGSYHGDTLGAMDSSEPGVFNMKTDWYEGRGFWFDYPTVRCADMWWVVDMPSSMDGVGVQEEAFHSLRDVFDLDKRDPEIGETYKKHIRGVLEKLAREKRKFGALIIEPVVLGAGGMVLV
ncbi:hypothetical protein VTK26DRAFT_8105 [Humicola hyalothermophila]